MEYSLPKLPERPQNSNKGSFGKVLNIAGSEFMPGAAYLSSVSALKVGAGYVKLKSCEKVLDSISISAPEIVQEIIDSPFENDYSAISIGCGCGVNEQTKNILLELLDKRNGTPTVIDADGLNVLAENYRELDKNVIITPHPKEASRLLNCSLEKILADTEGAASLLSEKYKCVAVLKTHKTIVTDGSAVYKNMTGCSALAKAGSGDVLTGLIAGLLAQGMNTFDAAVLGVYLHGMSGDLAAIDLSEYGVLASDLLKYIPFAVKNYLDGFV